ncbi:MAG: carbamoyl-phosphate synthase large subunit [Desulfatitalea sp. BRH_c12]|nr:MAG: carbamoyl-phosphate synthase large subunit [Desulfatitalea sp. BRH_c12]
MPISRLLIANRGEIAIRIAHAAADLDIRTVAVSSADDAASLHTKAADTFLLFDAKGKAAYLDGAHLVAAAKAEGCDAIHPGYGFLSENADFARLCQQAGIIFVGPSADLLALFGKKTDARALARSCDVPLLEGTSHSATLAEAETFFAALGPGAAVMIKAVAGGGGRGMRPVMDAAMIPEAFERCRSEALSAFGNGDLYVEKLIRCPRHIEIQVVGDGRDVIHLGERDCTLQRRNQKLIEVAPCPTLSATLRDKLTDAALRMARKVGYQNLGTFEFLVDADANGDDAFVFLEVNPRLQVEHTVTEQVTGIDLVRTQLEIAAGRSLADLGLLTGVQSTGFAVQLRINMETMDPDGSVMPQSGVLSIYEAPSGKDIRVDGCGYGGYRPHSGFDSLLAKLVVTAPGFEAAIRKAYRALTEFKIDGVPTNIPLLLNLLRRTEVLRNDCHTRFIEENAADLATPMPHHRTGYFAEPANDVMASQVHACPIIPAGMDALRCAMQGIIVDIAVRKGDPVWPGRTLAVIEAMKMEHVILSEHSGYIHDICAQVNASVCKGSVLFVVAQADGVEGAAIEAQHIDLKAIRPDLEEVIARHAFTRDDHRPDAIERRRKKNQRSARENVEDLCDHGSFVEYGALIVAAQRQRRSLDDLIRKTPADGLIAGIGTVNAALFGEEKARCMVLAYDFTVLAGTQGLMSHKKMDRMLGLANAWRLPTVLLAEGGGGRPGDTDVDVVAGLDLSTFKQFAAISGRTPLIGIVEGPCFAGNAALLGCCDVIIATERSNIGMGGPAMIEGGGLGTVRVEEIGPIDVQCRNGVVDIAVADEAAAVAAAKIYLAYFQGPTSVWQAADQRNLRFLIPENRLRVYDIRKGIETLADTGSVLELRRHFGAGLITALVRIEGHPFGLIANDPTHMSGAIEAEGADKAARFMQLCDAHGLPMISLCDTPGFMVGPEIEARGHVRHVCRMFVVGAKIRVPFFTVVLRKGYGLGAMAMSAGGFHEAFFTAAWPSGEFGGMGLEGAVKHAFKKELAAIQDLEEREETYRSMVAMAYARGKAINMASHMEIDAVVDPAETRRWIMRGLKSVPSPSRGKNSHTYIDPW